MHFFIKILKIFAEKFGVIEKMPTFAIPNDKNSV
jgi:hypothetical protein